MRIPLVAFFFRGSTELRRFDKYLEDNDTNYHCSHAGRMTVCIRGNLLLEHSQSLISIVGCETLISYRLLVEILPRMKRRQLLCLPISFFRVEFKKSMEIPFSKKWNIYNEQTEEKS